MPNIYVIAGPNGAGKSTTARSLLSDYLACREFVNADDIARGLSRFRPESVAWEAGRLMLGRLSHLARAQIDFAFETTLASRFLAPWLRERKTEGYRVHLIYCWLPSPEMAVARVKSRVLAGGHKVPEEDIRRRYERSRSNFFRLYMPLATTWETYDTSKREPVLFARGNFEGGMTIVKEDTWEYFRRQEYDS